MIEMHQICEEMVVQAAKQMCSAALTAPKGCGMDSVVCGVVAGDELETLAAEMERIERETPNCSPFFIRDAGFVRQSGAVVLIASRKLMRGIVPCGMCSHGNCAGMAASGSHCAFDDIDLAIAVGSAVSVAADLHIDNRIMFSAGAAAKNLNLLGEDVGNVLAIPLSVTSRNLYFVRQSPVADCGK